MLVKQYNVYESGELIGTYATKEIEKIYGQAKVDSLSRIIKLNKKIKCEIYRDSMSIKDFQEVMP